MTYNLGIDIRMHRGGPQAHQSDGGGGEGAQTEAETSQLSLPTYAPHRVQPAIGPKVP
jgi:hypothetical protein